MRALAFEVARRNGLRPFCGEWLYFRYLSLTDRDKRMILHGLRYLGVAELEER